jgi:hypothetical protein
MRRGLQIFSGSFILIFTLLQAQPLFISNELKEEKACASPKEQGCTKKKTSSCSRAKCTLPIRSDEKEDCNNNGCNPFVPCSIGLCCYVVENFYSYSTSFIFSKQRLMLFDDNRIASGLSECWHPPEVIS